LKSPVEKVIFGALPTFAEMEENVLYRSANPNLKAFDMVFRAGDELVCIQVLSGRDNMYVLRH
jgi:hypothetical protein